jgi:hypothetical protein
MPVTASLVLAVLLCRVALRCHLKRTIALLFWGLLLVGWSFAQEKAASSEHETKLANLYDNGRFLYADGVWRADNLNEKTEASFDSVVRLECYKTGGKELVGTDAYCMHATATIILGGLPDVNVTYYPVLSWDKDRVIASDSPTANFPICLWTQITINLHDHSIMATDTRKLGKGHEGLNNICEKMPLAQTYHLVDKGEELARRRIRAGQRSNKP